MILSSTKHEWNWSGKSLLIASLLNFGLVQLAIRISKRFIKSLKNSFQNRNSAIFANLLVYICYGENPSMTILENFLNSLEPVGVDSVENESANKNKNKGDFVQTEFHFKNWEKFSFCFVFSHLEGNPLSCRLGIFSDPGLGVAEHSICRAIGHEKFVERGELFQRIIDEVVVCCEFLLVFILLLLPCRLSF